MSRLPAQLPLSVGLRDDATFANFHPGPNAGMVSRLVHQLDEGGEALIYLWGRPGVGRSHLLQASCHAASDRGLRALYLPLKEVGDLFPTMLEEVERLDLLAIDNLECVVGLEAWEEAFFHAFNRLRDVGRRLLVAADAPPRQLPVSLPDLASRLSWGVTFHVQPLDDADCVAALQLRARGRGIQLSDEVAVYILNRGPRRLGDLFRLLETLDRASLSAQRRLTIPFVRQVLGW